MTKQKIVLFVLAVFAVLVWTVSPVASSQEAQHRHHLG